MNFWDHDSFGTVGTDAGNKFVDQHSFANTTWDKDHATAIADQSLDAVVRFICFQRLIEMHPGLKRLHFHAAFLIGRRVARDFVYVLQLDLEHGFATGEFVTVHDIPNGIVEASVRIKVAVD